MAPKRKADASGGVTKKGKSAAKSKGKQTALDQSGPSSRSSSPTPFVEPHSTAGSKSFVTASSGDAYLLASASGASKTSDSLLSSAIDTAFTLASYSAALDAFDKSDEPALRNQRDSRLSKEDDLDAQFGRWVDELQLGYSIALYGFGSKKTVLDLFAESLRDEGMVVVANGFDMTATLPAMVTELEQALKLRGGLEDGEKEKSTRGKGKGKAIETEKPIKTAGGAVSVSAIEGRVRRFCRALDLASEKMEDIYLVVHNLDGPVLRIGKTLSLLALLAAQPRLHLVTSFDHLKAALLFPSNMVTARSTGMDRQRTLEGRDAGGEGDIRTFTFVYYEAATLAPYTVEVSHSDVLSKILPPSVFPRLASTHDATSASLAQSTTYVLASVTDRSRKLFQLLAQLQVKNTDSLDSATARSILLTPAQHLPSPCISTQLARLKSLARDQFLATSDDQVETLLGEFMDHGVVRKGLVGPEGHADEPGEEGRGEWVWIPLTRDELDEVCDGLSS